MSTGTIGWWNAQSTVAIVETYHLRAAKSERPNQLHMMISNIRSPLYSAYLRLSGRGKQLGFYSHFQKLQFESRRDMWHRHVDRVSHMLRFSRSNVPYYRDIFKDLSITEDDIANDPLGVLRLMPLLDRSVLRDRFEDLKARDLGNRRWYLNSSGGSTGEPVQFVQDAQYHAASMANKYLFDEWSGCSLGMPKVLLWGSERDLLVGKESFRARVGRWLRNECPLNAFRTTTADMFQFVETINRVRPVQLLAYVDIATELANFIENEGLCVYSPKSVMTTAGTLYPHMREVIERVFRAPVFNRYGSREVGDIACECEKAEGLHINPSTHHVEILRPDGSYCDPGEIGEVVVTLLTNEAMPLLRYRIGDMAAWTDETCSCGRQWPLLKEVSGRIMDVLRRKDGSSVTPAYFVHFFGVVERGDLSFIKKYQLIQEDFDSLRLLIVSDLAADQVMSNIEKARGVIEQIVRRVMGDSCQLSIECVPDIPKTSSGKYRYIVSKLQA